MITTLMYKPHITCLSKDIVIQNDDKILTSNVQINKTLTNGTEVYCIDTSECYLYDEEGETLIKIKTNNDIIVDGKITPESVSIINNKVDNFISEIEDQIATADIDKIVELSDKMVEVESNIDTINSDIEEINTSIETLNNNKTDVLNTIGSESMGTTASTLKGAIAEHSKSLATKANLNDIKVYSSLNEIGLTALDMGEDFSNNVLKIIKAMGRNRKIVLYPYSGETNLSLYNSVKTWCGVNTDAYSIIIESSFNGGESLPNKIEIYPNSANGENRYLYSFFDNALGTCKEVQYVSDSGWLKLTLTNGSAVSSYEPQYRKIGNVVHLRGEVTGLTSLVDITTLPVGYRPTMGMNFITGTTGNDIKASKIRIYPTGVVSLKGFTDTTVASSVVHCLDGISFVI